MDRTKSVIENALSEVAAIRALRERNLERRQELQRRAEMLSAKPLYILKKHGGRQLSLKLDS
jgi:hypothetical protein